MKLPDEEMQNKIEGNEQDTSVDGLAYQRVFSVLPHPPRFVLPPNFADNVVRQIDARAIGSSRHEIAIKMFYLQQVATKKQLLTHDLYWLGAGVFVLIVGAVIGAMLSGFRPTFGAFRFFGNFPWLFAFGAVCLLCLQWVDKKIMRTHTIKDEI